MDDYALGIDVGGTSTRAMLVARDGTITATASDDGANPNSHPPAVAAARVASAAARALDGRVPSATVLGMAGSSKLTDPAVAALFDAALTPIGVHPRVVTDAEVAFASGTEEPHGTVLIAGTGSIAMRVRDRHQVAAVGGFGWLLGDEGSAFWIGREAVRATLTAVQAGTLGPLATAVLDLAIGAHHDAFRRLITAVRAEPPIHLARYAPLVTTTLNDPTATDIVTRAADLLATQTRAAHVTGPVVLAGAIAASTNPVGARLRDLLSPDHTLKTAADGATGAAWLAALDAWKTAPRPH